MNLLRASFYQAVELPTNPKQNFNTVSSEVIQGVILCLTNGVVIVSHPAWSYEVIVPAANVRFATKTIEVAITFEKDEKVRAMTYAGIPAKKPGPPKRS